MPPRALPHHTLLPRLPLTARRLQRSARLEPWRGLPEPPSGARRALKPSAQRAGDVETNHSATSEAALLRRLELDGDCNERLAHVLRVVCPPAEGSLLRTSAASALAEDSLLRSSAAQTLTEDSPLRNSALGLVHVHP